MTKSSDNNLIENILAEFEKSNNQINEVIRLQNELSKSENELMALQIRYVHKNKENDDLKVQLEAKTKLLNERSMNADCDAERYHSLEFHYNELLEKHRLCLECMSKQKSDLDSMEERISILHSENMRLEDDKAQLKDLFGDQVNDLEVNLKKLFEDNDTYVETIKKLNQNCFSLEAELDSTRKLNTELKFSEEQLKKSLEILKKQYDQNIGDQCYKLDTNQERINDLQIQLSKANSKIDEMNLKNNEAKINYTNQIKRNESLIKELENKDLKYDELKKCYENSLYQIQSLTQAMLKQKQDFEFEINEQKDRSNLNSKYLESESYQLKKQKKNFENTIKYQANSLCNQHKLLEELVELYKKQTLDVKSLKLKCLEFTKKFTNFQIKIKKNNQENLENEIQMKNLQEKCSDLELKYSEKCELLNNLERDNYLTKNSLESVMNEFESFNGVISLKNEEIILKNQTIDRLESIVNQLNNEINKRKAEINERITQIEIMDKHLKEEKNVLDLKLAHLEANLKSKSKQLHQRIDQIKELSDAVNNLKEEKDQAEYKIQQYENMNKCQKLEIESKQSIIKQLELRIKDTKNESDELKNELKQIKELKEKIEEKMIECKETQTDDPEQETEPDSEFSPVKELILPVQANNLDKTINDQKVELDELKLNLKIKENLIENFNDSLVLKDAEIARLKTRIAIMERKDIINEMNIRNE